MQKTKIEWVDLACNPVRGRRVSDGKRGWACTKCAAGCQHCYAEVLNRRFGTKEPFTQEALDSGRVEFGLDEQELQKILRSRATGDSVFVGDMTDLWHPNVPHVWLDRIFACCQRRPQVDFCLLTKRPKRMAEYVLAAELRRVCKWTAGCGAAFPPANLYLGLSASTQEDLDAGIGALMELAAAGWKTYLSLEPLVRPVSVSCWPGVHRSNYGEWVLNRFPPHVPGKVPTVAVPNPKCVIIGGETGPGARPMHPDWVRTVRDQCAAAGVPFFFKSWGEWLPIHATQISPASHYGHRDRALLRLENGSREWFRYQNLGNNHGAYRVGRKRAGRLLDGRTHDATPWHLKKLMGLRAQARGCGRAAVHTVVD